ncbi:MAG: hypothetical protein GEU88_03280 [Solirubrobacterales bacterium]|nr:hypothetical protein [Solirubrobacterales bacterium]
MARASRGAAKRCAAAVGAAHRAGARPWRDGRDRGRDRRAGGGRRRAHDRRRGATGRPGPRRPGARPQPSEPALLAAGFAGLAYPRWEREFGWRATGTRDDELSGRRTRTVFYESRGERIGYTIVAGDALDAPTGARRSIRDGIELRSLRAGKTTMVSWIREGHTCVLTAGDLHASTLVELAAWKGGGAVGF